MTDTPLARWDKEIAPHLQEIEYSAGMIERCCRSVASACRSLVAQPTFDTKAEVALVSVVNELSLASGLMRRYLAEYRAKEKDK